MVTTILNDPVIIRQLGTTVLIVSFITGWIIISILLYLAYRVHMKIRDLKLQIMEPSVNRNNENHVTRTSSQSSVLILSNSPPRMTLGISQPDLILSNSNQRNYTTTTTTVLPSSSLSPPSVQSHQLPIPPSVHLSDQLPNKTMVGSSSTGVIISPISIHNTTVEQRFVLKGYDNHSSRI